MSEADAADRMPGAAGPTTPAPAAGEPDLVFLSNEQYGQLIELGRWPDHT